MKKISYTCLYCGNEKSGYVGGGHYNKYCSNICSSSGRHKDQLSKWIATFNDGKLNRRQAIYQVLVHLKGNKCSCCGISEWNGKPLRLWVDHIDGTSTNNKPENLQLVCPNCDSQSPYFMARNKGNGRGSLGLKKWA